MTECILARAGKGRWNEMPPMLKIVKNESGNATMRRHSQERDPESLRRVVCNGPSSGVADHLWSGDAESAGASGQRPSVDEHGERCRFTSRILPPYLRRSPKVAEVLLVRHLPGLSTRDLRPARCCSGRTLWGRRR